NDDAMKANSGHEIPKRPTDRVVARGTPGPVASSKWRFSWGLVFDLGVPRGSRNWQAGPGPELEIRNPKGACARNSQAQCNPSRVTLHGELRVCTWVCAKGASAMQSIFLLPNAAC